MGWRGEDSGKGGRDKRKGREKGEGGEARTKEEEEKQ